MYLYQARPENITFNTKVLFPFKIERNGIYNVVGSPTFNSITIIVDDNEITLPRMYFSVFHCSLSDYQNNEKKYKTKI
jgi:hypothetical protein